MGDEEVTQELRAEQAIREREEAELAVAAPLPDEAHQHERRAEKAAYLKDKLAERAEAEEEG